MKKGILISAMLLATAFTFAQTTYDALFIGNSYTGVNNLPSIVQSLTAAGGDVLTQTAHAPGGQTLQGHSNDPTVQSYIKAQPWDFVILQEQSQIPSFPQSQVQNICYPYATALCDSIKANDSCTVAIFYMTWGRKYGDASNCGNWPPVCTYAGMQYELRRSYLNMANQNGALVAPCGSAWWESIKRDSLLELYSSDQSHPSYAGSYLNGCVFYATMYRRSPVGLNFYGSLDSTTAQFLQQVAHDVVFDSLAQWRIGLDDVTANFTATDAGAGIANFSNTSINATSYHWDFGDGGLDSTANPSHTYNTAGSYTVSLIATDGCTSDTSVSTLEIVIVGLATQEAQAFKLVPNPSNGLFKIQSDRAWEEPLQVLDLQGRILHQQWLSGSSSTIDLRHLSQGLYVLRIGQSSQRILLQ